MHSLRMSYTLIPGLAIRMRPNTVSCTGQHTGRRVTRAAGGGERNRDLSTSGYRKAAARTRAQTEMCARNALLG